MTSWDTSSTSSIAQSTSCTSLGTLDFTKGGVSPCHIITQDSHFDPSVPVEGEITIHEAM